MNIQVDLERHNTIKRALRSRGITFRDIAESVGVDPGEVTQASQGRKRSKVVEEAIAARLNTSPSFLWPDRYASKSDSVWLESRELPFTFEVVDKDGWANRPTDAIRKELHAIGVKIIEIARDLGVSASLVTQVCQGQKHSRRVATAVASYLGTTPDRLWPGVY